MAIIRYPQLWDRDWLYQKYWGQKLTTIEISKEVGCSYSQVSKQMKKLDIPMRSISEEGRATIKYPQLHDRDWLYQKYWGEGLNTREIGKELNCCSSVVDACMRRLNIHCRSRSEAVSKVCEKSTKYPLLYDAKWLKEQYIDKQRDSCDMAETLGCDPVSVRYALEKVGIARRTTSYYYTSSFQQKQRNHHRLYDKEWMVQKYVTEGLNQTAIAIILGCSSSSISASLRFLGIPIRDTKRERNPNFQHPKAYDRDFLWQRYVVEGKYTTEIAEEIGCARVTVLHSLKLLGIPTKSMKEQANEEKGRQIRSQIALKQWKDKEIVKKMFKGLQANPNKFEARIDRVLQKFIPHEWKYNGGFNCGISIGGLIPDFVNINGRKQLIEGFGNPFHDGTFGSSWKRSEFGRKAIFSQLGYDTLILWASDIREMADEEIAEVVIEFMGEKMKTKGKKRKKRVR